MTDPDGTPPPGEKLPHGRHGLSPEVVRAHQRRRLLEAAAASLADNGSALTVSDITARARVSRATFYEHFGGKGECACAAHDLAYEQLGDRLRRACALTSGRPGNLIAALRAIGEFASSAPTFAALLCLDATGADPELIARVEAARHDLGELLRASVGDADSIPDLLLEGLVASLASAISTRLADGRAEELCEVGPRLAELILLPHLDRLGADGGPPSPGHGEPSQNLDKTTSLP